MNTYTSNSTLCCHWCKIPLGNASQVTYLNGNLPICDLCLGTAQAQILSAFAEKDKCIAELEAQVEKMKKYKLFFESCSCLFAEGVELMTRTEIYECIKKETKALAGETA